MALCGVLVGGIARLFLAAKDLPLVALVDRSLILFLRLVEPLLFIVGRLFDAPGLCPGHFHGPLSTGGGSGTRPRASR